MRPITENVHKIWPDHSLALGLPQLCADVQERPSDLGLMPPLLLILVTRRGD